MANETNLAQPVSGDNLAPSDIDQLERHGYLFGHKITHSLSPFLHDVIYQNLGLRWGQIRLDSADMDYFLKLIRNPSFYGASVTMPNKVAIIPHLDELTDECRDVGACNTLFVRERNGQRTYCGANTDVIGIRDSFFRNVQDASTFQDKPALVIGGGGAARSAVYALRKWMGVTDIYMVNRDAHEVEAVIRDCTTRGYGHGLVHVSTTAQAEGLDSPGAIVACVPDFVPQTHQEILARHIIETFLNKGQKGAMLEMCYNPSPFTRLGALASKSGWQLILGTEAMIWQGLEQDRYWTGKEIEELPVKEVHAAIAERVAKRSAL